MIEDEEDEKKKKKWRGRENRKEIGMGSDRQSRVGEWKRARKGERNC